MVLRNSKHANSLICHDSRTLHFTILYWRVIINIISSSNSNTSILFRAIITIIKWCYTHANKAGADLHHRNTQKSKGTVAGSEPSIQGPKCFQLCHLQPMLTLSTGNGFLWNLSSQQPPYWIGPPSCVVLHHGKIVSKFWANVNLPGTASTPKASAYWSKEASKCFVVWHIWPSCAWSAEIRCGSRKPSVDLKSEVK